MHATVEDWSVVAGCKGEGLGKYLRGVQSGSVWQEIEAGGFGLAGVTADDGFVNLFSSRQV